MGFSWQYNWYGKGKFFMGRFFSMSISLTFHGNFTAMIMYEMLSFRGKEPWLCLASLVMKFLIHSIVISCVVMIYHTTQFLYGKIIIHCMIVPDLHFDHLQNKHKINAFTISRKSWSSHDQVNIGKNFVVQSPASTSPAYSTSGLFLIICCFILLGRSNCMCGAVLNDFHISWSWNGQVLQIKTTWLLKFFFNKKKLTSTVLYGWLGSCGWLENADSPALETDNPALSWIHPWLPQLSLPGRPSLSACMALP